MKSKILLVLVALMFIPISIFAQEAEPEQSQFLVDNLVWISLLTPFANWAATWLIAKMGNLSGNVILYVTMALPLIGGVLVKVATDTDKWWVIVLAGVGSVLIDRLAKGKQSDAQKIASAKATIAKLS